MKAVHALVAIAGIILFAGCDPMGPKPMVERLSDNDQKAVNESWDRALSPVDHLDRQALLDVLVYTQAYQVGVDRLTFRSEKKVSVGIVVMEIHFDRDKPNEDRFEVIVRDKDGKELRRLAYTRAEVESTFKDLHDPNLAKNRPQNAPPLAPEQVKKQDEMQRRIAAIEQLFPKREQENQK